MNLSFGKSLVYEIHKNGWYISGNFIEFISREIIWRYEKLKRTHFSSKFLNKPWYLIFVAYDV